MEFEFCVQDPTDPGTRYLYEAIIGAATITSLQQFNFTKAFLGANGSLFTSLINMAAALT